MRSWWIWLVVTVLVALYVGAGAVESSTKKVAIKLEPGYSTQLRVFRLAEYRLQMRLTFQDDQRQRPELGNHSTRSDFRQTGTVKYENPGAAIRIVASTPGVKPVIYEAKPASGYGGGNVFRELTASPSIARGVWQWPSAEDRLVLRRGTNVVSIDVVAVEAPLIGEAVELWVDPALGFKQTMPNVEWLWGWFLWPLFVVMQLVWAASIGWRNREIRLQGL